MLVFAIAEFIFTDSIAAALQSYIGNVSAGSLFAFCQSVGAGGWAAMVLLQSNMLITIGVLLATTVQVLVEKGIIDTGKAKEVLESVWVRVEDKFSPPSSSNGEREVAILKLRGGWVKHGLCAWVGVHVATFALQQGGY